MAGFSKKDEQYRQYALTASPVKVIMSACMPLALYQVLQSVFKIFDALLASHIGAEAVSAVSCLSQITLMITALGSGLAIGGSIHEVCHAKTGGTIEYHHIHRTGRALASAGL
jgi:Na+-driven multidrug efflux pump